MKHAQGNINNKPYLMQMITDPRRQRLPAISTATGMPINDSISMILKKERQNLMGPF